MPLLVRPHPPGQHSGGWHSGRACQWAGRLRVTGTYGLRQFAGDGRCRAVMDCFAGRPSPGQPIMHLPVYPGWHGPPVGYCPTGTNLKLSWPGPGEVDTCSFSVIYKDMRVFRIALMMAIVLGPDGATIPISQN